LPGRSRNCGRFVCMMLRALKNDRENKRSRFNAAEPAA
jgi:hypothetical protein